MHEHEIWKRNHLPYWVPRNILFNDTWLLCYEIVAIISGEGVTDIRKWVIYLFCQYWIIVVQWSAGEAGRGWRFYHWVYRGLGACGISTARWLGSRNWKSSQGWHFIFELCDWNIDSIWVNSIHRFPRQWIVYIRKILFIIRNYI